MSRLTSAQRRTLPDSAFGLPDEREFPMPDLDHAVAAKMDARLAYDRDLLTKRELERVLKKANTIIERHIMSEAERRGLVKNPPEAEHKKAGDDALDKMQEYWWRWFKGGRKPHDLVDAYEWAARAHVEMKYAKDPAGLREAKSWYGLIKKHLTRQLKNVPDMYRLGPL